MNASINNLNQLWLNDEQIIIKFDWPHFLVVEVEFVDEASIMFLSVSAFKDIYFILIGKHGTSVLAYGYVLFYMRDGPNTPASRLSCFECLCRITNKWN